MNLPPLPTNKNKRGRLVGQDGTVHHFTIIDQIEHFQSDYREKALILQKIQFDDGSEEVRLAYYIIGKKPGMKGKWVWGQYATLMPLKDYLALYNKAKQRGWF